MEITQNMLFEAGVLRHLVSTAITFVLLTSVRFFIIRKISGSDVDLEIRRKWIVQIKNIHALLFFISLIIIWASELQNFAISLVAFAAALAIVTKEFVMCFLGTLVKSSNHLFKVGDRIEIDHQRGDVISNTFLTTTLLEVGPGRLTHQYTGRSITIPNSLFLLKPIINESYSHKYMLHTFTLPLRVNEDWEACEKELLDISNSECASYFADAKRHMEKMAKKEGIDIPYIYPRIIFNIQDPKIINVMIRLPVPVGKNGRIEQSIIRRFLLWKKSLSHTHRP